MLAKILRFLRLRSSGEAGKEAMEQEFHDLPDPRKRARMSPEKLAILLSQQQAGAPAYILVEHELDLRIASVQSRATVRSAWLFPWSVIAKTGAEPPRANSSLGMC